MTSSKMKAYDLKVYVTGPFQAGKTTFIHTLDPETISIERDMKEEYRGEKGTTTTAFDLGHIVWVRKTVESNGLVMSKKDYEREKDEYSGWVKLEIELRGVPGQLHFKFVRDAMRRNTDGVLLIIDASDYAMLGDACAMLSEVTSSFGELPLVIVANKQDREDAASPEEVASWLGVHETFGMCGKDYMSSQKTVTCLLHMLESRMNIPVNIGSPEVLSLHE